MSTRNLLPAPELVHEAENVDELSELRDEVEALKSRIETLESDRKMLGNMLYSLRAIFCGQEPAQSVSSPGTLQPNNRAAWEAWKSQLPSGCGKIIDALLIQPLRPSQMMALCKMAYPTVTQNLRILANNGLTEKEGGKIRLKRL